MEIVTTGKKETSKRLTCEHCEAVFDVEKEELNLLKACKDYKLYVVNCPCCGRECLIRDIDMK